MGRIQLDERAFTVTMQASPHLMPYFSGVVEDDKLVRNLGVARESRACALTAAVARTGTAQAVSGRSSRRGEGAQGHGSTCMTASGSRVGMGTDVAGGLEQARPMCGCCSMPCGKTCATCRAARAHDFGPQSAGLYDLDGPAFRGSRVRARA